MFFRFIALSIPLWRFRFCLLRNFFFRIRFLNSLRLFKSLFLFLFLIFCRRLFLHPFFFLFRFLLFLFLFFPFLRLNFFLAEMFLFRPFLRSRFPLLFCFFLAFCRLLSSAFRAYICCLTAAGGCLVTCFETIGCILEP